MKSRNKNIVKIITLILALFAPQKMLAWGVHAGLFHNQSTGHTVALLGDNHAKSNTDRAEPLFETITKPHFERLLTQDNTYHLIVEGDEHIDLEDLPEPEADEIENMPLLDKLRSEFYYQNNNFMNIPITTQLTLNDERETILMDVRNSYHTLDCGITLFCENCIKRITAYYNTSITHHTGITQEYAILVMLEPEDRTRYLLETTELQKWLLYHPNPIDVKEEIIQLFARPYSDGSYSDGSYFSAQDILNNLDYYRDLASNLASCENQQHKKLWEFYSTKLNEGYVAAKNCFQILDENDLIKDGAWKNALVNDIFTHKSIVVPWIDDIISSTLPEFGFMVKIIEDIPLHKKTFLYAGADHSRALKPQLESIGYTRVLEFNCPYEQTLAPEEYDQFFTHFFA